MHLHPHVEDSVHQTDVKVQEQADRLRDCHQERANKSHHGDVLGTHVGAVNLALRLDLVVASTLAQSCRTTSEDVGSRSFGE